MDTRVISIIVAMDRNRVIGRNNRLPWGKIRSDLKRFNLYTMGHDMIMGRSTFESLPDVLDGRHHIIMSRSREYSVVNSKCTVVHTVDEALSATRCANEVFVIGGAEIYSLFFPMARFLYITTVDGEFEGDTLFPEWDRVEWKPASTVEVPISQNEIPTSFRVWERTEALRL